MEKHEYVWRCTRCYTDFNMSFVECPTCRAPREPVPQPVTPTALTCAQATATRCQLSNYRGALRGQAARERNHTRRQSIERDIREIDTLLEALRGTQE